MNSFYVFIVLLIATSWLSSMQYPRSINILIISLVCQVPSFWPRSFVPPQLIIQLSNFYNYANAHYLTVVYCFITIRHVVSHDFRKHHKNQMHVRIHAFTDSLQELVDMRYGCFLPDCREDERPANFLSQEASSPVLEMMASFTDDAI